MDSISPMTFDQIIALGGLIVAAISVIFSFIKSSHANVAESQRISDKLDLIQNTSKETRDTVRELSHKLDDHGERLTGIETRMTSIERRVDKLESKES